MRCLRLSASRKTDHYDRDAARMEKAAGHGTIELGRRPLALVIGHIVDAIYEGRALAAVPRRTRRDFRGAVSDVSACDGPRQGREIPAPPSIVGMTTRFRRDSQKRVHGFMSSTAKIYLMLGLCLGWLGWRGNSAEVAAR